ncbi:MAG: uroporphyrinogen-III C-methyltransferase [Propionibacteriaceae bacterium]
MTIEPGTVVLVGGGPGDPDLITVAGLKALKEADVIVHDRLGPLSLLAECRADAERINVGKIPRGAFTPQEEINRILIDNARHGKKVVRLKGGDNFVFGRGGEECIACAEAGIPVQVIPGVTSAISVPALVGVPVTHRSLVQGFTVVSGHVAPQDARSTLDWDAIARSNTTLVILMGVHALPDICQRLISGGKAANTPAVIIADGCAPTQRCLRSTLAELPAAAEAEGYAPPSIVVVGDVAALDLLS